MSLANSGYNPFTDVTHASCCISVEAVQELRDRAERAEARALRMQANHKREREEWTAALDSLRQSLTFYQPEHARLLSELDRAEADRCCERDPTDGGHDGSDCPRVKLHKAEERLAKAVELLKALTPASEYPARTVGAATHALIAELKVKP